MPSKKINLKKAGIEVPISVQSIDRREEMLWISNEPAKPDAFPPCIRGILSRRAEGHGKHRTAAILASFLGQAGYGRDAAKEIWSQAADAKERIFDEWFRKMHCPKCRAMQRQSRGYPDLGVADLGLCLPDEVCRQFQGPVEYACRLITEEDKGRGSLTLIKIIYLVRVFDWSTGKEGEIEVSQREREELEALLAEKETQEDKILVYTKARVKGRLRPRFYLRDQEGPRRQMLSDAI
ncbi:MAG: hypothetical protein MUE87_03755 [Methanothrix sp.]|jgi:hypothetical protein|nr:hypothetical protein [Methanothrix sp.]